MKISELGYFEKATTNELVERSSEFTRKPMSSEYSKNDHFEYCE